MRAVLQRVISAAVKIDGETVGQIDKGLLILLGIHGDDTEEDLHYLVEKIVHLRIFEDENNKMNLSLLDIDGSALVVSQFTLYADTRRGRRPGFSSAAAPEVAEPMYRRFCEALKAYGIPVATGRFGADMDVQLINQGPVTIIIDSEQRLTPRRQ
ncbi:MAG: D-tyrosyl-tRNA(Tyr) deacylase [Firmicutes bacterium]|nr:D-tyrosyl-tRNA(Tyr) deacylase [Bacillota bacterium]